MEIGNPIPFELTITPTRAALTFNGRKLGKAIGGKAAGQVELMGGEGGNDFRRLTISGQVDGAWAKTFFTK